eukprot:UN26593
MAVAYNGGKDSIVTLHLVQNSFFKQHPAAKLNIIFWNVADEFPEIQKDVSTMTERLDKNKYNFITFPTSKKMAEDVRKLGTKLGIKYVFLGTRNADMKKRKRKK